MPCWGPLQAYYPKPGTGDKRLVFDKRKANSGIPITVPCGKCSGCKLEHSRQWALRCLHEKKLHKASAFLTLTYDDAHLPPGSTLVKSDLQNFMKRTRNHFGVGVRFFACGEYGEKYGRPHYHVLLLSHAFEDARQVRQNSSDATEYKTYTSATLSTLWTAGNTLIGDVTFHSAAYVARYCMKKITGPSADGHYKGRQPEFIVMSRRPGIGHDYFNKYKSELLAHDNVIVNGLPVRMPRFYDNKIAADPDLQRKEGLYTQAEKIKNKRRSKITQAQRLDNTSQRLRVREVVTMAKLKLKRRSL